MTASSTAVTASIEEQAAGEQVRVLYDAVKVAAVTGPIGVGVVAAAFWSEVEHWQVVAWASACLLCIGPGSLLLLAFFRRRARLPRDAGHWLRLIALRYALVSASFGMSGVALFVPGSVTHQIIVLCLNTALASSLTTEVAQHRWVRMATLPPLLLPFMVRAAIDGHPTSRVLAVLAGLALIYVLVTARSLGRMIQESLSMRFRNQDLVLQLQQQKEVAERSRDDALRARRFAEAAGCLADEARAEAVEANRAKSRFLAAASHDLRQPMHALTLFTSAVRPHVEGVDGQRVVDRIDAAVASMETMFRALLDVSRLDAGILVPDIRPVVLADLLAQLLAEYAPRAAAKGITLRMRRPAGNVLSDPSLLERILRNYLSNAIRYTATGGVLIGARARGGALRIEVWDTGIGIPRDKLGEIYQEFYQLGNPERDKAKGLGLGLAIVKRIATLLGHRIEVASVPQRGSMFAVTVPLTHDVAAGADASAAKLADEGLLVGAVILAIDDEWAVLEAIETVMRQWGCHVMTARSLEQAQQAIRRQDQPPDVVLCDYRLRGGENGIGVIQALQQEWNGVSAALLTGDTAPDRLKEAAECGYELLSKPVNARRLKSVLCRMMAASRARPISA